MCVGVCAHVYASMWKPETNVERVFFLITFLLYPLRQGLSVKPRILCMTSLAS